MSGMEILIVLFLTLSVSSLPQVRAVGKTPAKFGKQPDRSSLFHQ